MKTSYWIAIAVVALIVGILVGYGVWGPQAARLPQVETQLNSVQAQMGEVKKKMSDLEANLGKVTNEKLNLEKQTEELKEALEKATKKRR
ncbi:MAG: hypothetical protein HYT78_09095 [Deltaproteobacteria bacterium]|jgi:peptidoglycan hydrolase CwlO-like protein|nr:hypothetical protein [Deltaproteobacteria bacterium]